jgi:hypothetical protein
MIGPGWVLSDWTGNEEDIRRSLAPKSSSEWNRVSLERY